MKSNVFAASILHDINNQLMCKIKNIKTNLDI